MTPAPTPPVESFDGPMPFPSSTAQGVKIAVIDSGVNPKHPHIPVAVQGVAFDPETEGQAGTEFWEDTLGHGTAVTAAIQEKAPGAEYFILKLFGAGLRTTTQRLILALNWAVDHGMHVVNLSLGTPNVEHRPALEAAVARAAEADVLLVSARGHGEIPMYPGMLPGVIGVDLDWDLPRHSYRIAEKDGQRFYYGSGFPRSLPGMAPRRNLHGISFAVANLTGIVARACETLPRRTAVSVEEALGAELKRIQSDVNQLQSN